MKLSLPVLLSVNGGYVEHFTLEGKPYIETKRVFVICRQIYVYVNTYSNKPIDPLAGLTELGMVAANVVARAIARGVYTATALPFPGALPAWKDRFG